MASSSNLPAIAPKSPLAEGATVNIRPVGSQHQLRIWIAGSPVENSMHDTPTGAVKRLAQIVLERMGGQSAIAALLLSALARAELADRGGE